MLSLLQSQKRLSSHTIHQNWLSPSIWRKSLIQSTISWRMKITWQAWAWTKSRSPPQLQSLSLRKSKNQNHNLRVNQSLKRLSQCLKESLNLSLNLNLLDQNLRSHFQEKKNVAKKKLIGFRKSNQSSSSSALQTLCPISQACSASQLTNINALKTKRRKRRKKMKVLTSLKSSIYLPSSAWAGKDQRIKRILSLQPSVMKTLRNKKNKKKERCKKDWISTSKISMPTP